MAIIPAKGSKAMIRTLQPVTVGGWYERTDGTVARYQWVHGQLVEREVASSWAEVRKAPSTRARAR
jgi:hypothetical protein